ncbi:MSHA biogenesis protein MshN [Janthinobacterium sp. CG_23.3]|uniref:tetratricopeptide repeat protein n=1 Tax=Janthinobacterium sp. CG_23.3 TaxID=3349634 RepID=UPI0038D3F259
MSLINKMLQDLDARGSQGAAGAQDAVRPVPGRERAAAPRMVMIGALAVLVGAGGAALGWRVLHKPAPPVPPRAAAPAVVVVAAASPPAPAAATPPLPVAVAAEPVAAAAAPAAPEPAAPAIEAVKAQGATAGERIQTDESLKSVRRVKAAQTAKPAPARADAEATRATINAAPVALQGKESNVQQRAENEYRRALAALQEGRVNECIAGLEQALAIDPRHQAARETLIRLLLEGKRPNDAVRHLQLGLALDPAQPAMAMMLARLQLESGGPAVETLMRTLPFAGGDGDYRAFLAAVLQRGQRHKEAAEQYELALRGAPQNGVWWMGLGISLQAEQRLVEAKDAFARAKGSASLSPELQAFVERKLQQLPH